MLHLGEYNTGYILHRGGGGQDALIYWDNVSVYCYCPVSSMIMPRGEGRSPCYQSDKKPSPEKQFYEKILRGCCVKFSR